VAKPYCQNFSIKKLRPRNSQQEFRDSLQTLPSLTHFKGQPMLNIQSNNRLDAELTISAALSPFRVLTASSKLHGPRRTWTLGTLALFSLVTPFLGAPQAEAKRATKPKKAVVQTPAKTTNSSVVAPGQANTAAAIAVNPATSVATLQATAVAKPLATVANPVDVETCQTRSESTSSVDGAENKGEGDKQGNKTGKEKDSNKNNGKDTTGAELGDQSGDRNGTSETKETVQGGENKDKDSQKSERGDDSASQNRNQCTLPARITALPIVPVAISAAPQPAVTPALTSTATPNSAATPPAAPVSIGMSIDAATTGAPLSFTTRIANTGGATRLTVVVNVTSSTLPGYLEAVGQGWSCSGYIKRPAGSASFTCTGSVAAANSSAIVVSSGSKISSATGSAITVTATANPGSVQGSTRGTIR
jgi:hypothetical protein